MLIELVSPQVRGLDFFFSKANFSFTCLGALDLSLCPQHDLEGMLDIDVEDELS